MSKSRNRSAGGSGLGLSMVKAIITRHGWNITAESTVGLGAIFPLSFYLS